MGSAPRSRKDAEKEVRSWGFSDVFTWTDRPYAIHHLAIEQQSTDLNYRNAHYAPHQHSGLTTHLILNGQLTITYPKDERPEKTTYGVGDRIDVDAGRVHEVWIGSDGCTYVIGE
jgi:hypothetical protein